jgi:hypothetical protein
VPALGEDLVDAIVDGQQHGQTITTSEGTPIPSLIPDPQTATLADAANTCATMPPAGLDAEPPRTSQPRRPWSLLSPQPGTLPSLIPRR